MRFKIIGTIIEIENYIHNTVSRFSLDKYFPLEKNIENPWTSDSSNSHSDDINNRSNNDPSHPNKSSNFEYRNKHENPPNIPPSLPPSPSSLSKPGNERRAWRKRFRKKNTVYRVSPPLLLLPISFFLRKPLRREISSVTTRTRRATNILYLITISTSGGQ